MVTGNNSPINFHSFIQVYGHSRPYDFAVRALKVDFGGLWSEKTSSKLRVYKREIDNYLPCEQRLHFRGMS